MIKRIISIQKTSYRISKTSIIQFYQKPMNECVLDKIHMIKDIRKALDRDEFLLFYQPKMKIKSGNMTGLEALIRWDRGERSIISPAEFIPFAEERNLISFITDWVINEAYRH